MGAMILRAAAAGLWLAVVAVVAPLAGTGVGETGAGSEPQAPPERALAWEEILPALDRHPAVQAALSEAEAARAAARAAGAYPNPEVELSAGRSEPADGGDRESIRGIDVSLPLLWPWKLRSAASAASADRDAALAAARGTRLEAWRELRGLYWRVAYHQRRLGALERSGEQVARLVDLTGLRVAAGDARPVDLARLEIEGARAALALEASRGEARLDREALALWIGVEQEGGWTVEADLDALPDVPELREVLARASERSPDLHAARLRAEAADARWRAERQARFPELTLGAFYEEELDATSAGGTLALSLPLWDWNGAAAAQARAEASAARHAHDAYDRKLALEVAAAHAASLQARREALAFRDEILPRARLATEAMERLYELGEAGLIDLLDARRTMIETEMEMLAACLASHLAALDLEALWGGMNDEDP